jgi:hypothetical protein
MTYDEALEDILTAAYLVWSEDPRENDYLRQVLDVFCAQHRDDTWPPGSETIHWSAVASTSG